MKNSFFTYVARAFNARPLGMPIPPNWIGLAGIGLLGLVDPGFWLIGAGIELAYLLLVASNKRFQKTVDGESIQAESESWAARKAKFLNQLSQADIAAQDALENRCRQVLNNNNEHGAGHAEHLEQLAWVHLRLLLSRTRITRVVDEAEPAKTLIKRIADLTSERDKASSDALRASLSSQLEILVARQTSQNTAREQLTLINAEIERLRQQVELVREQLALANDTSSATRSLDALTTTLGQTTRWLSDQRDVLGEVAELSTAPPTGALFNAAAAHRTPEQST